MTEPGATKIVERRPSYSEGKALACQIFHETMAAIEVGGALRTKVKREGRALVMGGLSLRDQVGQEPADRGGPAVEVDAGEEQVDAGD